jgi:hypothetical protein
MAGLGGKMKKKCMVVMIILLLVCVIIVNAKNTISVLGADSKVLTTITITDTTKNTPNIKLETIKDSLQSKGYLIITPDELRPGGFEKWAIYIIISIFLLFLLLLITKKIFALQFYVKNEKLKLKNQNNVVD